MKPLGSSTTSDRHRSPRWRVTPAMIAATFLLFQVGYLGTPSSLAKPAAPTPTSSPSCGWAKSLTDAGFPQRAVIMIDQMTADSSASGSAPCPKERKRAEGAVSRAQTWAEQAHDLAPSVKSQQLAQKALKLDADNALASEILNPADSTCVKAADLTGAGYPQRAVSLIDQVNAQGDSDAPKRCQLEYAIAAAAVEDAQREALNAKDLEPTNLPSAKAIASDAQATDRENAVAQAIVVKPDPTTWQDWVKTWGKIVESSLNPIGSLIVPAIGLLAALLLTARILVFIPVSWSRKGWARWATVRVVAGSVAAAVGSLALVGALVAHPDSLAGPFPASMSPWVWIAAFLCVLGVVLTTWGLATRLRIGVVAHKGSSTDEVGAAHVLALLDDLGASPPRGLEKPQGVDVTALDGALESVSTNPVAKILKSIIGTITGWQPWQVRVDEETGGTVSVAISRNGYSKGGAVIDLRALGLTPKKASEDTKSSTTSGEDPPQVDPHRFAAAVVLTTLARHHRGFEGLCGATDWQSLGLHYVATTDFKSDEKTAKEILARAVDRDQGNWLAQTALASYRWRNATEATDIDRYIDWLTDAIEHMTTRPAATQPASLGRAKPGYEHLRLRARSSLVAAEINKVFGNDPPPGPGELPRQLEDARHAMILLCMELILAQEKVVSSTWLSASRANAAATAQLWSLNPQTGLFRETDMPPDVKATELIRRLGLERDRGGASRAKILLDCLREWMVLPLGPRAHYSLGCTYASWSAPDNVKATTELLQAWEDPELAEWLHKDPQLTKYHDTDLYRRNFGPKPRTEILDLPPFKPLRPRLEPLGMVAPSRLAGANTWELARSVGVPRSQIKDLQAMAKVAVDLEAQDVLSSFSIELLARLIEKDRASSDLLRAVAEDQSKKRSLAEELAKTAVKFEKTGMSLAEIAEIISIWVGTYA